MAETKIKLEDFKPNSHKSKEETQENSSVRKIEKAIQGTATIRKKSFAGKFAEAFFDGDFDTAYKYAVREVMIPAIKRGIVDTGQSLLEMIFLGRTSRSKEPKGRNRENVSYTAYYKSDVGSHSRNDDDDHYIRNDYRNIVVNSRGEAEEVIDILTGIIEEDGSASVADLYDAAGITQELGDTMAYKFGWTNLRSARPRMTRTGWLIDVPRANPLPNDFE